MAKRSIKVTVSFERRADGGLRAWSDDVPGLVLSHSNVDGVLADVETALEVILSERFGEPIVAQPLVNIREMLEDGGIVDPPAEPVGTREYVAFAH